MGVPPGATFAYETWGQRNAARGDAIYVAHALTGDSHLWGSTGPASAHPADGKPWGSRFPYVTMPDMVATAWARCTGAGPGDCGGLRPAVPAQELAATGLGIIGVVRREGGALSWGLQTDFCWTLLRTAGRLPPRFERTKDSSPCVVGQAARRTAVSRAELARTVVSRAELSP